MSCLNYMGQAVFAGTTRNKTLPDFISCFARHVGECERTGRNGSTANYRMAYRMLVRYAGGGKLPPEQFTAEWLERYERWLLARGLGTNSVVFHMRSLRAVYNRAVEQGLFPAAGSNPFRRRLIKQVATRKRALPRETLRRPLGLASQICAGARSFHVQFLHPGHVVRRHDLPAQKRCP